jgi:hypothetical protein
MGSNMVSLDFCNVVFMGISRELSIKWGYTGISVDSTTIIRVGKAT